MHPEFMASTWIMAFTLPYPMTETWFMVLMGVLAVLLIGLFILLRKMRNDEDE